MTFSKMGSVAHRIHTNQSQWTYIHPRIKYDSICGILWIIRQAGSLLQKYNLHVPGAVLPKGHTEQNGSLMVGHHTLAA